MRKINILHVSGVDRTIYKFRLELLEFQKKTLNAEIFVACEDTGYLRSIESLGYKVCPLMVNRSNPLSIANIKSIFKIVRFIITNEIEVVHTHTPIGGFIGRIAASMMNIKNVFHTTGGFYFNEHTPYVKKILYVFAEKILAKQTNVIFSVNKEDIKTAEKFNISPKNYLIYTGGAGVDTEVFDPNNSVVIDDGENIKKSLNIKKNSKVILFLGRATVEKGIHDFFEVALKLVGNDKDLVFILVGLNDFDTESEAYLEIKELNQCVKILGLRDDIPSILHISDILLFPSYREGMPVSPLEAMAMEVPVVTYNIRGCREEIVHGENGYIVKYKDRTELLKYTELLLMTDSLREKIGRNGRRFVKQEFERKAIVERQITAYQQILSK